LLSRMPLREIERIDLHWHTYDWRPCL
jgi:hypothetical protein